MDIYEILMCVGAITMGILFIVQNYVQYRLFKTLRKSFETTWIRLGKPSLIMNNSISNSLALMSYLWRRDYLELNDASFSKQCGNVRTFTIFSLLASIVWVVGGFIYIITHQIHSK